jgi:hypothetical protein
MPAGFVETVMPKLNRLLLGSDAHINRSHQRGKHLLTKTHVRIRATVRNAVHNVFKFNIASSGAENFQLTMTVTEAFEDIVDRITDSGPDYRP